MAQVAGRDRRQRRQWHAQILDLCPSSAKSCRPLRVTGLLRACGASAQVGRPATFCACAVSPYPEGPPVVGHWQLSKPPAGRRPAVGVVMTSNGQRSPAHPQPTSPNAAGLLHVVWPGTRRRPMLVPSRPLSFAQEALWFLDQLRSGAAGVQRPQVWCLVGSLDVVVLQRSLQPIIDRHGALRTTFGATDGRPYQQIHGTVKVALPIVDLGAVDASLRDAEAMRLAVEAGRRPLDGLRSRSFAPFRCASKPRGIGLSSGCTTSRGTASRWPS